MIWIILGIFFVLIGAALMRAKNTTAGAGGKEYSAKSQRISGVICIICGIIIVGCGIAMSDLDSGSSSHKYSGYTGGSTKSASGSSYSGSSSKSSSGSSSKSSYSGTSSKSSSGSFTNKYGTSTTKCAHAGCNNPIASSGDTNCCTVHSRRCLECGKYIDEDAMYCMDCLTKAVYN